MNESGISSSSIVSESAAVAQIGASTFCWRGQLAIVDFTRPNVVTLTEAGQRLRIFVFVPFFLRSHECSTERLSALRASRRHSKGLRKVCIPLSCTRLFGHSCLLSGGPGLDRELVCLNVVLR